MEEVLNAMGYCNLAELQRIRDILNSKIKLLEERERLAKILNRKAP